MFPLQVRRFAYRSLLIDRVAHSYHDHRLIGLRQPPDTTTPVPKGGACTSTYAQFTQRFTGVNADTGSPVRFTPRDAIWLEPCL